MVETYEPFWLFMSPTVGWQEVSDHKQEVRTNGGLASYVLCVAGWYVYVDGTTVWTSITSNKTHQPLLFSFFIY